MFVRWDNFQLLLSQSEQARRAAASFLACSFFLSLVFLSQMYAVCMSLCVCMCVRGLGEELLCCDGSLCGAGLNARLYWSSAETLG